MLYATGVVQPEAGTSTANLRPFWGRVMVIPSAVNEEQRQSGLIVPMEWEGDEEMRRGVVTHVDETIGTTTELVPGSVVYYRGGVRVGDTVVLDRHEIYAFEVSE